MPVSSSARYYASRFDYWIGKKGQAVSIYAPGTTVTGGNPAQNAVTLAGTSKALFEFGEAARDNAALIGIDPSQAAMVYILSTDAALLVEDGWIKDANGRPWWVRSRPNPQMVETTVVGVSALVTWTPEKPPGMP